MLCRVQHRFSGFLLGIYDVSAPWRALEAYARDRGYRNLAEALQKKHAEDGEIIVSTEPMEWWEQCREANLTHI